MLYRSTRSNISTSDIDAVLQGIAPDGGLYINPDIKDIDFDWQACLKLSSQGMASMILSALLPGYENMDKLVENAYQGKFETEDLTPLVPVGGDYVLELFRGPTSAFKDVALSMLPHLITAGRRQLGIEDKIVILTATSGDTGKAALEGFHDVEGTGIIVFYPAEGVSPIQKAQMVTQQGGNVHVCAVKGNFDDCQTGVKQAFSSISGGNLLEGKGIRMSSANSINIGRLAPQVVYYFISYAKLLEMGRIAMGDAVDFIVPTGNFGDILAGYYAKLMGLPVGKLVCASNANKVLTDFINTGVYDRRRDFIRTASPSMDILVSSNLERLLYLASEGDAQQVSLWMQQLQSQGYYTVSESTLKNIRENFFSGCCDEDDTKAAISRVWKEHGYLCDPHTAVAFSVMEQYRQEKKSDAPMVVLSTASPFKFPAAVLEAIGGDCSGNEFEQMQRLSQLSGIQIPKGLSGLKEKEALHNDLIDRENLLDYVLKILEKEIAQ